MIDEQIADQIDRAMARAFGREIVSHRPSREKRGQTLYFVKCPSDGCTWLGNSRRDVETASADFMRHAGEAHAALVRKHLRDIERSDALEVGR